MISEPDFFEKSVLPKILATEELIENPIDVATKEILSKSPITCKNVREYGYENFAMKNLDLDYLYQRL